jgi:hypothetical protein
MFLAIVCVIFWIIYGAFGYDWRSEGRTPWQHGGFLFGWIAVAIMIWTLFEKQIKG